MGAEDLGDEFGEIISTLFGKEIEVEYEGVAEVPDIGVFALFVNEDDTPVGAITSDFYAANYLGAALTRIPAGGAEDSAEEEELPGMAKENIGEVYNVCTQLFQRKQFESVKLDRVEVLGEWDSLEEDMKSGIQSASIRGHYTVDIPMYGIGKLSIFAP